MTKASSAQMEGSKQDQVGRVSVVSAFREEGTHRFGLDFVQFLLSKVADWKGISHTREIDCLVKDHCVFAGYAACVENATVLVAT